VAATAVAVAMAAVTMAASAAPMAQHPAVVVAAAATAVVATLIEPSPAVWFQKASSEAFFMGCLQGVSALAAKPL
jgi:hypothetical protein